MNSSERARLERVEALAQHALSQSSAGLTSFAGPIVADEASAKALVLQDGRAVFVTTERALWTKKNGVPGISAPPLSPNEVIPTDDGTGVLSRMPYSDPSWRLGISDVYIDDTSDAQNQGIYLAPTLSPQAIPAVEFTRRWGNGNFIDGTPSLIIRLHILTAVTSPGLLSMNAICHRDTFMRTLGENTAQLRIGTLAPVAGWTVQNPNAAGGGTANIIKDSIGLSFAAYIGKRVFFPRTGAHAYILLAIGGDSARISEPQVVDEEAFNPVPVTVPLANGDAYIIEEPVHVNWGRIVLDWTGGSDFEFTALNNFADITVTTDAFIIFPAQQTNVSRSQQVFYRCVFTQPVVLESYGMFFGNCCAPSISDNVQTQGTQLAWYGGALVNPTGGLCIAIVSGGVGDAGSVDMGTHIQGGFVWLHGFFVVGRFAVWDTPVNAADNPLGCAIMVGGSGHHALFPAQGQFKDRAGIPIFGNGAAGVGIRLGQNCNATWEKLFNIEGALGQFRLGSGGNERSIITATALPSAAPIGPTWAALDDVQPGGFGGSAHELNENIHLVKLAV